MVGTCFLSILSGHKCYSHVTAIRCDGVSPGLLGMGKVISYTPRKSARPSHSYYTYLMAGTCQVPGVEVRAGNEHTAKNTQSGLL